MYQHIWECWKSVFNLQFPKGMLHMVQVVLFIGKIDVPNCSKVIGSAWYIPIKILLFLILPHLFLVLIGTMNA